MKSFAALFALLAALASAAPSAPKLVATSAAATYPAALKLGSSIEGCSVDSLGNMYAVNQTHFVALADAAVQHPLLVGAGATTSHFAASRWTCKHGALVGDAAAHKLWNVARRDTQLADARMLQPNDFAVSRAEDRIYLAGMNYTANTGDLWFYDVAKATATQVRVPGAFRMNGVELSADDRTLYVTSAENSPDATQVLSAKVWKLAIDPATGVPGKPVLAIDLYKTLQDMGLDPKTAGMDPDGMRMDARGTLFMTLNAFGRVLMWDTAQSACSAKIISLETIQNPTNLELGGADGKTLVVVGRCRKDLATSCVDSYRHSTAGRAFTNLQGKKTCLAKPKASYH
jgi:gluconolactonase